ncbi:3'-5' exonuclease domain-containing protein [Cynara cardunculus var. scolymus]|uniref:3'-5' exonuclease domain-containing protein n=1 Tax=Cynara cardunculus var. scolymus TaxID=59895 RepID=A0A103XYA5_CYNCS|nr:3'-5' exonuclease domain-containing protein [Cynara cardunculus var. scolymus]
MAFTTPTNTFKKPPSYLWFCHSCPRSTTSMVSSSSSYSPSSCRSVWSSSDSNKPLYRWQSQNPLSKKDRFCNISMVFSRYNSWSNISTMSFDESRRYVNSMNNQSCADFRLHVESRRGNSYAQMVPWGNKDGNTYITPVLDAHPRNPFREKDFRPQTWNQATQALRKRKEEVRKVGHAVPNVQYAGSVITEPREHEARDMTGYEKFPSQPPNGNLQQGVSRKMQISSPAHNGNTQKHGHDVMHNSKSLELKQEVSENTPVNGVHRMDSQSEKRSAGRTDKSSAAANADALKETYIVPLDSKNSTHLRKRLMSIYEKVLVVDNISLAKEVVRKLTTQYRHLVAAIDVKQETPVDHGEVICFSIYSGHEADFGNGKSCIWVDVLDGGGKSMLDIFSAFFENPSIKKVWHNYSFDNHVIENYDLKLSGFHADTMHMARLWDSSRRMSGGYSLEALTSDSKGIMSGADLGPNEELIGKVSMKNIFGRKKLKKDGSEGKVVVIPPVEVLQRVERVPWVCYSALDSISTLKLYERLKSKLSNREWKFNGVTKGTLFDFYEQYWRPFGELLVKMETEGMLVDRDYLMEIEEVAKAEQQIAADRFRNWASKQCADAKFMNEFKVPNVDNIIEEGKKTATKFRKIKLKTICSGLQPETYTASGWPSVCGDVLKSLAGKVSMDYDFVDEETAEVDENADDPTDIELSETKSVPFVNNSETAYGTAYAAFGGGSEGHEACHAIAALCEVCSIDSNGRIHCSLNINTETGRLSARRPNLQNQPALEKDRYKIRQAFIAAPGNSLIVADYGQLELRILAHLADCKSMLDAFKAGGDFHSRTAMNMYPYIRDAVESKEVLLEWHPQPGEESPPVPLLKVKKIVSVTEARETVARWYGGREEVLRWQEARKREARKIGCVYTLLGRARTFPSTKDASPSHRGHIERAAINTPVQVHDEVILEGPSESADVAKAIVVECMSKPFDGKNILKVGLSVDAKFAKNWYSAK